VNPAHRWRPDLHERLARRYAADVRALRAAAAGLVASLLAWTFGLGPSNHALVVIAVALVAAALPVRPPVGRALGWIGRHAGLAYQTHVEHQEAPDPYGLLAEGALQARLSVRGVTPPARSTWWLPLAALSVAIWLVAAVVGGPGAWGGLGAGGATPGAAAPRSTPPTTDPAPATAADEPTEEREDPAVPGVTGPRGGDDAGTADAPGAEASERETVERFLDNLRERPSRETEREGDARGATRDGVRDEAPRDGAGDETPVLVEGEGEREATLRRAPGPDEAEGDEGEEPGAGGEGGDEGDEAGAEGDGDDATAAGEEGEDRAGEAGADAGGDTGPSPDAGERAEDGGEGPGAPEDEAGLDGGDGAEAGAGRGAPSTDPTTELPSEGELEALRGILQSGVETPGGRVRLPGRDDAHLPEGRGVERYERAAEEAITDGSVPVPYQEIIRNYFR
jgi:hypothetical protein